MGWGFSLDELKKRVEGAQDFVAIPFRVGWGFSLASVMVGKMRALESQSLSGWDGVFHLGMALGFLKQNPFGRNPFQGGMGFFTGDARGGASPV